MTYDETFNKAILRFLDEDTSTLRGYLGDLDRLIVSFKEKQDDKSINKLQATKEAINSILQQRQHTQ